MKFAFIDKEQLCVYDNGKKEAYESAYITRYRENQQREQKNREWKKQSDVMMYEDFYGGEREGIISRIHAISPTLEDNRIIYAFSWLFKTFIYFF